MNNDEFYTYEDRAYIKPTLSSGEQEKFIDNLRDTQKQNTAQIGQQTYNLGTQVPSNLGGLGGGESYFTSRYQTPQTNEMVETLKSAAQAQALNDILSNYQSQLKNRYSQAQRSYNKRQRARQKALQDAQLAGLKGNNPISGVVRPKDTTIHVKGKGGGNITNIGPGYTPSTINGVKYVTEDATGKTYRVDDNGNLQEMNAQRGSSGFERWVEDTLGGAVDFVGGLLGINKSYKE